MRAKKYLILIAALLAFICGSAIGGELSSNNGALSWKDAPDGAQIDFDPDGSVNRVYCSYRHAVSFPDRKGILKAQRIAEEKAKACIVRFIEQKVATSTVVTEIDQEMNDATRKSTAGNDEITKTNNRRVIENLTEITGSSASATLRGIRVIEQGYDEKEELAWVQVGFSKKTLRAAGAVQQMINGSASASGSAGNSGVNRPGSESRSQKNTDW